MINDYITSRADLLAVEEGIKSVFSPKLSFIFFEKNILRRVTVISFDRKNFYLWSPFNLPKSYLLRKCNFENYSLYKIPHKITITDNMHKGWQEGSEKDFTDNLSRFQFTSNNWFEKPVISGGLLTPFIKIHQKIRKDNLEDIYYTKESYLATIVHEFAHVYYHFHRLWWFSDKKENLFYLQSAKDLYGKRERMKEKIAKIKIPVPQYFSEVFAFCAEYSAAFFLWKNHLRNIHTANIHRLNRLLSLEKEKNLNKVDSVLLPTKPHDTASVFGIILISQYPSTWPQKILKKISM